MYIYRKYNRILVDTPKGYDELSTSINNHKEAAEHFLRNINQLYEEVINEKA